MFNGFGSSVSLDTLSITSMMDTYNTIGSNTKYNAWGSGHENDWWDNQLDRYTNSFNNGGWNSNNCATSILHSGGIGSYENSFGSAPSFGTPLPQTDWSW